MSRRSASALRRCCRVEIAIADTAAFGRGLDYLRSDHRLDRRAVAALAVRAKRRPPAAVRVCLPKTTSPRLAKRLYLCVLSAQHFTTIYLGYPYLHGQ